MTNAQFCLDHGALYPYDASDAWWDSEAQVAPTAFDWAHKAARGILVDLKDRRGIKHALGDIDEETRVEIVQSMAAIIRVAKEAA